MLQCDLLRAGTHGSRPRVPAARLTSSATVRDGYDAIIEACCNAWNKLMEMTERTAFLTRRASLGKTSGRIGRLV